MASNTPDFALDLAPEGVNLWQRSRSGDWMGLGFVPRSADGFDQIIESHRAKTAGDGPPSAEIRIPKSDVYFTQIKAEEVPDDTDDAAILDLIADRIPFRDKQAPMIVDTCPRGSGDLAIAVVRAKTLKDAGAFAQGHGFEPGYFTTLYNPMIFPAEPRFHLARPAKPRPRLKARPRPAPVAKRAPHRPGAALAFVAVLALCFVGVALIRAVVATAPAPDGATSERIVGDPDFPVVPASVAEPEKPLPQPRAILAGSTGPTPVFAADVIAPDALPSGLFQVKLIPDVAIPAPSPEGTVSSSPSSPPAVPDPAPVADISPAPSDPASPAPVAAAPVDRPAQVSVSTPAARPSTFEPSGLMTRTRRMLDNSFITIEEPRAGETGRKTIRILPTGQDEGSLKLRFDPRNFVRVAQAPTSVNDAGAGLPDVDNDLLQITESGVPLFEGTPGAVPPPRAGTGPGSTDASTGADDGLQTFSDGIADVLDATDAPDASAIVIKTPSLATVRPRANPFLAEAKQPEAVPLSTHPVQPASAAELRPRPRPESLSRRAQKLRVEAALEQARQDAIRENMPTANAVFVSLLPKPRPDSIARLVERTKPGLTSPERGSNAVVRSAPQGAQKNGTMTTSKTPESVAELATESARLSTSKMSLIGIFGTSASRRALLRLPSGRYIKVKQGDDVGGWNISAIGESSVRVKRGSRDRVLRMPE